MAMDVSLDPSPSVSLEVYTVFYIVLIRAGILLSTDRFAPAITLCFESKIVYMYKEFDAHLYYNYISVSISKILDLK